MTKEHEFKTGPIQELNETRSRIEGLISKVSNLQGANLAVNKKISDMVQQIEDQQINYHAQPTAKDDEIRQLLCELEKQVRYTFHI